MNKRRKIDSRVFSSLRPDLTQTEDFPMHMFRDALSRFADEYLRAAVTFTAEGESSAVANMSLEGVAYTLRLMVQYAGEGELLNVRLSLGEHMTLDVEFPRGLPSFEDLSVIAAAGRSAGLHFEARGNRVIFRTRLVRTGKISVYAKGTNKLYDALLKIFFE